MIGMAGNGGAQMTRADFLAGDVDADAYLDHRRARHAHETGALDDGDEIGLLAGEGGAAEAGAHEGRHGRHTARQSEMFAEAVADAGGGGAVDFLETAGARFHQRDVGLVVLLCHLAHALRLGLADAAAGARQNRGIVGADIDGAPVDFARAGNQCVGRRAVV